MALNKYWKRSVSPTGLLLDVSYGQMVEMGHLTAPKSNADTLIYTRATAQLSVVVSSLVPPPEQWWANTACYMVASFSITGSSVTNSPGTTSKTDLVTSAMQPTLMPSVSAPGEYILKWESDFTQASHAQRKGAGGLAATPAVNLGVWVDDQSSVLQPGAGYSVQIWGTGYLETLWGSTL